MSKNVIVATEKHADGGNHIHIFVEFSKKIDIKNPRYFDLVCPGHHGNIGTVRYLSKTLRYITKDGDYRLFGYSEAHLKILLEGASSTMAELACAIQSTENFTDIALLYPAKFITHHRGMRALHNMYAYAKATATTPFTYDRELPPPVGFEQLHTWLVDNFFAPAGAKPLRSRQLFLHGPTKMGKTRLYAFIARHYRGYLISKDEKYMDDYSDHAFDYMIMDEMTSGHKVEWWNSLLGGEPLVFPYKGGQIRKRKNMPVLLAANSPLDKIYRNVATFYPLRFEAFLTRLLVLDLGESGEIHPYVDWLEHQELLPVNLVIPSDD